MSETNEATTPNLGEPVKDPVPANTGSKSPVPTKKNTKKKAKKKDKGKPEATELNDEQLALVSEWILVEVKDYTTTPFSDRFKNFDPRKLMIRDEDKYGDNRLVSAELEKNLGLVTQRAVQEVCNSMVLYALAAEHGQLSVYARSRGGWRSNYSDIKYGLKDGY